MAIVRIRLAGRNWGSQISISHIPKLSYVPIVLMNQQQNLFTILVYFFFNFVSPMLPESHLSPRLICFLFFFSIQRCHYQKYLLSPQRSC